MISPLVSIIIVNWKAKQFLNACLSSVMNQTYKNYEIIVVDNGSTDGSVDFIKEYFPEVRLIQNKFNLGFAEGNNEAAKQTKGRYLAFLNQDTIVHRSWLRSEKGLRPET